MNYQQIDWLEMESLLTPSAADSPAKTSAPLEKAPDLQVPEAAFGGSFIVLSRKRGRSGSSRKTYQPFAVEDWTKFSGASLRSGTMRNGTVYPLPPLAHPIEEIASGLLPTSTTMGNQLAKSMQKHQGCRLLSKIAGGTGGMVSPKMYEWMMGYPTGWTELKPLEMPSSRKSRKSSANG